MTGEKTIALVDGSAYIFRAFHALPPMNRADGTPINAVYGFTNMVLKLMDDMAPERVVIVLDHARDNFRNKIYPEYKANRSETPEELVPQFSIIREAVAALNLPMAEHAGFEADDIIAAYAKDALMNDYKVIIVSSDKDLMQLVKPGVVMFDPMKHKTIDDAAVVEKFGVLPEKVVDVQALAGDSTDNVPGVPGIGVKTAAELINRFGSLDELLDRADEIKQPKRRENLIEYAEMARLSRELVRLDENAPMPIAWQDTMRRPLDVKLLTEFLQEQNFKKLLSKVQARQGGETSTTAEKTDFKNNAPNNNELAAIKGDYELVTKPEQLKKWVAAAEQQGYLAIDTETTSLTPSAAMLVGISLAVAPGKACYIPLRHVGEAASTPAQGSFDLNNNLDERAKPPPSEMPDQPELLKEQIPPQEAFAILRPLLSNDAVLKIGHNIKYDGHVMARKINGGCSIAPVDDTMCLSFVLDAGARPNHKLDDLASSWLDHKMIPFSDVCGSGAKKITFDKVPPNEALAYAAEDADMTLRLWLILKPRLAAERRATVYERLERPLINVLVKMEAQGIKTDPIALNKMSKDFAENMMQFEQQIHTLAGRPFNIGSPKQLGEILFDEMALTGGKKSKSGAWSTDVDVLDRLAGEGVEIAAKVLEWRHVAKLKSTYADALVAAINPESKRVHTSFSMVGASTGRLSSSDPNLQNIPIRTAEGRRIRQAFIAEEGNVLISADYSQIELRLIAHIAEEKTMIDAFKGGADIHAQTAAQVFGVPIETMDSETRRRAKAINFGIIYGISAFGLARQLGISKSEATAYINAYFERFPNIKNYMNEVKLKAREEGYVETLFGRRLYIQGITASNQAMRGFAERQAINAPIQGTAADIIKQAMVRMEAALMKQGGKPIANMLLQVHDELIFEATHDNKDEALNIIKKTMEAAALPQVNLSVPIIVEAKAGQSWNEAH